MIVGLSLLLISTLSGSRMHASDSTTATPNDNRISAGTLVDGLLTLRLVARSAWWQPEGVRKPTVAIFAFAEEGRSPSVPGPLIRVPEGTQIRATVRNGTDRVLRMFGLQAHPAGTLDSVEIRPGESREIRFGAGAPGTFMYWGRTTRDTFALGQFEDGMLTGAMVVDSGASVRPPGDRILVAGLWSAYPVPPGTPVEKRSETLVFNGRSWPNTERVTYAVGDTVRWRVINATRRPHPLHLHGFYFDVNSRGTPRVDTIYAPADRRLVVTQHLPPGQTMSLTWVPHTPGNWLFHCHNVEHFNARIRESTQPGRSIAGSGREDHGPHEMSGLVLGIHVNPGTVAATAHGAANLRKLRLFVTERPRIFGDASALSFVLQEGAREPARDSLRIPGSLLTLTRGEPTQITVINRSSEPTGVHWHGIELESYFDGVPGWSGTRYHTATAIAPEDSFVVQITPRRAGTFMYHTHANETRQLGAGLFAPLIVLEPGATRDSTVDRLLVIGGGGPGAKDPAVTVNGMLVHPPIELRAGTNYRLRFVSITPHYSLAVRLLRDSVTERWRPVAKDGQTLPANQAVVSPARWIAGQGETADFEFTTGESRGLSIEILATGKALPPTRVRVPVQVRSHSP